MSTLHIDQSNKAAAPHDKIACLSITHHLQQRDAALERLTQAFTIIEEAHHIATNALLGSPSIAVSTGSRGRGQDIVGELPTDGEALRICRSAIDAQAWRYLMQESGMRSLMSGRRRRAFDEQISNHEMPELTREAVYASSASCMTRAKKCLTKR